MVLKNYSRLVFYLLVFNILLLSAGSLIIRSVNLAVSFSDLLLLCGGFSVITLIIFIIFLKGTTKEKGSQVLYLLVSVSLKLLLELIFALIWFLVVKKTKQEIVVLFFILYLAFTLFSIFSMLNALKHKSL